MDREHEHRRTPRRDEPLFLALMAVNTSLETTRRALDLVVRQQRERPREAETRVASEVRWEELFEVVQETARTIEGELAEEHPWRVYAQGASVVVEQLAGLYSRFTQRRAANSRTAPRREPAAPHPRSRRRRRGGEVYMHLAPRALKAAIRGLRPRLWHNVGTASERVREP